MWIDKIAASTPDKRGDLNGVDATPSNALIRQCFPGEPICLTALGENLARGGVPTDLTQRAFLALVFNARWVLAECCIDPIEITGFTRRVRSKPHSEGAFGWVKSHHH